MLKWHRTDIEVAQEHQMAGESSSPRSVHPALANIDPYTSFLYTPHTITCLVVGQWKRAPDL